LQNDSLAEETVAEISRLAGVYFDAYDALESQRLTSRSTVNHWTVDVLAVAVEALINGEGTDGVFTQFAYDTFSQTLDMERVFEGKAPDDSETALYVAIQRALLKADPATIRAALLGRYQQTPDNLVPYVQTNQQIDALFDSQTTERLYRVVDRQGAPLRILRHMIDDQPDFIKQLESRDTFLSNFEDQVRRDYGNINERVNRGVVKSVVFLVITKFLIGIGFEVPYDYLVHGSILWTPLLINLLFPPIYMILLRSTMMLPGEANTQKLSARIDSIVFGDKSARQLQRAGGKRKFGNAYNIAYALVFVAVFGGVALLLWLQFGFDIVHLLIFFSFLSAASFLGFRLSRNIREYEAVDSEQNGLTLSRDFLYMPFVVVGRYISDRYAKVNIVALMLDLAIELPLKTVLRLVRQWGAFISSKKDEL